MSKDLRTTWSDPAVYPLVSPTGRLVFSLIAKNLSDGLLNVEKVNGRTVASLSAVGKARGYQEIKDVADSPEQAEELFDGLVASYNVKKGGSIPEDLMPSKLKGMRAVKKSEKVAFKRSSEPKAASKAPKGKPKSED